MVQLLGKPRERGRDVCKDAGLAGYLKVSKSSIRDKVASFTRASWLCRKLPYRARTRHCDTAAHNDEIHMQGASHTLYHTKLSLANTEYCRPISFHTHTSYSLGMGKEGILDSRGIGAAIWDDRRVKVDVHRHSDKRDAFHRGLEVRGPYYRNGIPAAMQIQ
jgi:hypothetical protein